MSEVFDLLVEHPFFTGMTDAQIQVVAQELGIADLRQGREKVITRYGHVADRPGLHTARPAYDRRRNRTRRPELR